MLERLRKIISGTKEGDRSSKAISNIFLGLIYRALGVIAGFAYFPISVEYLGKADFGVFLILISVVDWFSEFDFGVDNGVRNLLGKAIAEKDTNTAKSVVSTAYFALGGIFSGVSTVAIVACYFMPWAEWLDLPEHRNFEVAWLTIVLFAAIALSFLASLVYSIYLAHQRTAFVDFAFLLSKILFLISILGLLFFTSKSLWYYGLAKGMSIVLIPLIISVFAFKTIFRDITPSYKFVKKEYFQALFSLGIQFFIIKVAMIIIHQTNNVLIGGYISSSAVADYEAAYKYLSIFLVVFVTLTNQLWSAGVEAFSEDDVEWLRKALNTIMKIWFATLLLAIVMVLVSPYVLKFLLREEVAPSFLIPIFVAGSIALTNWINSFNLFINASGKLKLQMYGWIFAGVTNIPLSIYFANTLDYGTVGVVMGTIVCMLPLAVIAPIQVTKILNKTDTGIWSK